MRRSHNVDYLLDEEEEPSPGRGKLILFALALFLVAGFGYLHFRQGGFDWLNGSPKKPAPSTEAAPAADSGANAPSAANAPIPTDPAPPTNKEAAKPEGNSAETPAALPPASAPPAASPSNAQPEAAPSQKNSGEAVSENPGKNSAKSSDSAAADESQPAADDSEEKATAKPTPARAETRKPAAARSVAKTTDNVAEAERYIYGRGVAQDCDRGMRLLKASELGNAKAMVALGNLYSTGTCAPRDLPTAYRWFAMALHKDPDNAALQDDLQKLWGVMTAPERQLAIKLSQ